MNDTSALDPASIDRMIEAERTTDPLATKREEQIRQQQRERQLAGLMPDGGTRRLRAKKKQARENRKRRGGR